MNRNSPPPLYSLGLSLAILGACGIAVSQSPFLRSAAAALLADHPWALLLLCCALLATGAALAWRTQSGATSRDYYRLHVSGNPVTVDKKAIDTHLSLYWRQLFPNKTITHQLIIAKNCLDITVDLPDIDRELQAPCLERIQADLRRQLSKFIGYQGDFTLTVSFASPVDR
jgi:hypothetical protein